MRVLVLDGNENQAVACVRSLARAGHEPWVGAETAWSKAGWSRAAAGSFRYPAPDDDADAFVRCVATEASRKAGTWILPVTERSMLPVSAHREQFLAAGGCLVLPPHAIVVRAFDKQETTRLAASLGIPVPATVTVASDADAVAAGRALRFPVVVKPRSSNERVGRRIVPTGRPAYARDPAQLIGAWREMSARASAVLVQEFVEGRGVGYFALASGGRVLADFAHRRLRDVRPTGSGSSLRVSVAPDPHVRDFGRAILAGLEWTGVAMVEFRLRPDGLPCFLEVNGRFWNSLALAVHAGADFPAMLARMAGTGELPAPSAYREGVRCRWLLGDVRHLVEVWRGAPGGFPGRFPSRLATLADVLRPVPGTCHDNFSWQDPLPELGDWVHFLARTCAAPRPEVPARSPAPVR